MASDKVSQDFKTKSQFVFFRPRIFGNAWVLANARLAAARPAPEAGDADPTHGSSDFQAFLQSEIGGLRAHGLGNRVRIREPCAHPHPFAHTEMLILLHFTTF